MKSVVVFLLALALVAGSTLTASGFTITDRIKVLEDYHGYYPCMDCHADQETITTPRLLVDEHESPLEWEDDEGNTHVVEFGESVSFAELLGLGEQVTTRAKYLARIGVMLQVSAFMDENGYAPEDSIYALMHGGANLWCLDCHSTADRDMLHKMNGELLSFNQTQFLCGQCHGPALRDWEQGVHGRTNGYWSAAMDTNNESIRLLCVECHNPHAPVFRSLPPMPGPVSRIDNISSPDARVRHESPKGKRDDLGPHPWEDAGGTQPIEHGGGHDDDDH